MEDECLLQGNYQQIQSELTLLERSIQNGTGDVNIGEAEHVCSTRAGPSTAFEETGSSETPFEPSAAEHQVQQIQRKVNLNKVNLTGHVKTLESFFGIWG